MCACSVEWLHALHGLMYAWSCAMVIYHAWLCVPVVWNGNMPYMVTCVCSVAWLCPAWLNVPVAGHHYIYCMVIYRYVPIMRNSYKASLYCYTAGMYVCVDISLEWLYNSIIYALWGAMVIHKLYLCIIWQCCTACLAINVSIMWGGYIFLTS